MNTPLATPPAPTSLTMPVAYLTLGGSLDPNSTADLGNLVQGTAVQFRPVTKNASNVDITSCTPFTYSSTNTGIATVSSSGIVTAVAIGTAGITIGDGTNTTTVPVTVSGNVAVTTSVTPASTGTTTGGGTYLTGSSATVTATPSAGQAFSYWTDGGVVVSTSASYTFTVTSARALVANFNVASANATVTLSSSPAAGGTTTGGSGAGTFASGTSHTVTASPASYYRFVNWTEGSTVVSTNAVYTFTVTGSRTLVANFVYTPVVVQFPTPYAGVVFGNTQQITANIQGQTFAIASATATVGGRTVALAAGASNTWVGTLNLAGLPRDTMTLTVTGTDANGGVGSATAVIIHDAAPTVTVAIPLDLDAARPNLNFAATCGDDDPAGCASFVLRVNNSVAFASGTASLSGTVSLNAYNGSSVQVMFVGTDSRGQTTTVTRTVHVENSLALTAVGVAGGQVIDAVGTRALFKRTVAGASPAGLSYMATGVEDTIPLPVSATTLGKGFVTPNGAIMAAGTAATSNLYDWRSGSLTASTQALNGATNLDASTNYAVFGLGGTTPTGSTLYRRDLIAGTDVTVASAVRTSKNVVAENGSVAYSGIDSDIYFNHGGTTTPVTADNDAVRLNYDPRTDGTNVLYQRNPYCDCNTQQFSVVLYDGTTTTVLVTETNRSFTPGADYDVNGGWVAFLKSDAGSVRQIWTRSPAGVLRKVTSLQANIVIEGLAPDGTVVFRGGTTRYSATATGAPQEVSSNLGTAVYRGGEFLLLLGRTVWKIAP